MVKCTSEGANTTIHIKGTIQFYRDYRFHGKTYLLYGYARSYFHSCQFLNEKSYDDEKIVFTSQSSYLFNHMPTVGFMFQLCEFHLVGTYDIFENVVLGGSSEDYASVAANFTDYEVYGNTTLNSTAEIVPSFVHPLRNVEDACRYSLRNLVNI